MIKINFDPPSLPNNYRPCSNCDEGLGVISIEFEKEIHNLEDKPRNVRINAFRLCPSCAKSFGAMINEKFNPQYPYDKTIEHTKARIFEKFDEAIEKQSRHIATHFDGGVLEGLTEGRKIVEEITEDILNE